MERNDACCQYFYCWIERWLACNNRCDSAERGIFLKPAEKVISSTRDENCKMSSNCCLLMYLALQFASADALWMSEYYILKLHWDRMLPRRFPLTHKYILFDHFHGQFGAQMKLAFFFHINNYIIVFMVELASRPRKRSSWFATKYVDSI